MRVVWCRRGRVRGSEGVRAVAGGSEPRRLVGQGGGSVVDYGGRATGARVAGTVTTGM